MNRKAALTGALRTAQLAGAALDVLALEPPDEHEDLIGPPNVVITPPRRFLLRAVAGRPQVRTALRGEIPRNAVNRLGG
ncbi:NAD(P)-dependent oxidoreductase [Nonomuraea sp. NPDC049269]|uniref:NAD(P)-dependent oxidoreductase n=1 Tax=Nonomuraea sp. NPDC049269 TaxID=3364349 RepID=UPI00371AFC76